MSVVVDEELIAGTLSFDSKSLRPKGPQTNDFPDDAVARDFHRREMALRIEGRQGPRPRCDQERAGACGPAQKITTVEIEAHTGNRLRKLLREANRFFSVGLIPGFP